jgi:proteasome lid subunit RPN8/RPN11
MDLGDHAEFFENLEEDIEEKKTIFKKIFIGIIALFVIIMFLSAFLTTPESRNVLVGLFESSSLDDDLSVNINGAGRLFFINNSYDILNNFYDENVGLEFKACLFGYIGEEDYYINEVIQPTMYSQAYDRVVSEPCANNTLVTLHSHPHKRCSPSHQDMISFSNLKELNSNALMAIMCDENRFNVYYNLFL